MEQVAPPLLSGDRISLKSLDVILHVRQENFETSHSLFEVIQKVCTLFIRYLTVPLIRILVILVLCDQSLEPRLQSGKVIDQPPSTDSKRQLTSLFAVGSADDQSLEVGRPSFIQPEMSP